MPIMFFSRSDCRQASAVAFVIGFSAKERGVYLFAARGAIFPAMTDDKASNLRRLSVLGILLDGRTKPSIATGASTPTLQRMREAGLLSASERNMGFHGKPRLAWSITTLGIETRLEAERAGVAPVTPVEVLLRLARECRQDALSYGPASKGAAAGLCRWAEIYERHAKLAAGKDRGSPSDGSGGGADPASAGPR